MTKKLKAYQRKYIVNRHLQYSIILYSLVLAICVSFTNFGLQSLVIYRLKMISEIKLMLVSGLGTIIIFGLAIFFGLVFTNRIAGPIFRLRQHMEDVSDGKNFESLEFRDSDYFSELVAPYNRIVVSLKEKAEKNS